MKKAFVLLSSLKLAVVLLVVLLVGLSVGTIIESQAGVEVAQNVVYYAWWFLALEGLFAVNVLCSIVAHFPWGNQRIGYLITHGAILVILAGALVTYFFTTEGQLGLWEGESGNVIENVAPDGTVTRHTLPFDVTLDDFRVDHYQGTMRPSNFASRVRIADPNGQTIPVEIWMNHEYTHHGYTLFQSSYQQANGREASVFRVAKDPGQPIVFVGYFLLVLGMCVVLGTRIVQRRQAAKTESVLSGLGVKAAAALLAVSLGGGALAATPADVEALRRLPVQHDGRQMPFDTVARELVWNVTGDAKWNGEDPAATVARWLEDPRAAAMQPVIAIGGSDLAEAIGLSGRSHVAFMQLVDNAAAARIFGQVQLAQQSEQPRRGVLGDAEKLLDRAGWFQKVLNQDLVRPIPVAGQPAAKWNPARPQTVPALVALANGERLQGWKTTQEIERELTYNAVRPTHVAWIVLAISLVLSAIAWRTNRRLVDAAAFVTLVAGFGVMTWGIGMRWAVAERIPAANMYESMLFLAWGVGLFAVVAFAFIRNRLLVLNAAAGATITMMLTDLLPIDAFIHPIPPVLAGTPWLAIHVPIIMVSYSVLALGVIIAHAQVVFSALGPKKAALVEKMADLNYWYMFVGSILLIVGIMTGSMWAAESWGRYWGWDPKEVWSLVAWLAYMAILHGRVDRLLGQFGVAVTSILAFQTILMTYLGVNYVLGTGLHSYGFGDSPIATWMLVVALAEAIFLSWGYLAYRKHAAASGTGTGTARRAAAA
ncbi:MAG TPA: cytochrome c biogenesis protein CcsA [Anaeromyxobacteraceae bacterium]|nr:cytochrome c biogenesis protein CcsA [Anaeromyxobacteraceae bacterium]